MATGSQSNGQKERLIAKLVEIKRKPKIIIKTNKATGEANEYYYASYIWDGERSQITSKSLSDFVEKVDSILFQLSNPNFVEDTKESLPIKDAFNIYLKEIRLPKLQEYNEERRQRNYRHDFIAVHLVHRFFENRNTKYFHEIDDNAIQSFKYNCLHDRNNSGTTFNRRLVILISLNRYLKDYTAYKVSECNFDKFKVQAKKEFTNHLTDIQIESLLNSSPTHLQRLIKFFLYTGMRKQNGLDLKWTEIDFINRHITVQVKQNKTHTVPVIKSLLKLLNEIKEEQISLYGELREYVFLYKGNRIRNGTTAIKKSLVRANITLPAGQCFHVFRHTCAVTLINKGVDLYTVQKILGHSSPSMTQRYARLQTETIAKELERVFGK